MTRLTGTSGDATTAESRLALVFVSPALLTIGLVALFPVLWTFWESLHLHDLRMPWLGRPFVGLDNYIEAFGDARFGGALAHTAVFTTLAVSLEMAAGLMLALVLNRAVRYRGITRVAVLLPWAIPTVVVALVWRFMFESQTGVVNSVLLRLGLLSAPRAWLIDATDVWVPVILADVWKMTPFVAILLLAGLQSIDPTLYEAARVDGAGSWRQLTEITLPMLRPALFVALVFRTLDAFRVFDIIYVLTGGGPGTATEPISLYAFANLLQNLRFGYGAALSVVVFLITLIVSVVSIRLLGRSVTEAAQ